MGIWEVGPLKLFATLLHQDWDGRDALGVPAHFASEAISKFYTRIMGPE